MNTLQIFVLALVLVGAVFAVAPPQVYDDYGYNDYGYSDYGSTSSGGCCCGSGAILAVLGAVVVLKKN